jgi:hypothetical protein
MRTQYIETPIPQSKPRACPTQSQDVATFSEKIILKLEENVSNDTHPDMLYAIARSYDQKSVEQIEGTTARERFLIAKNNSHQH